MIKFFKTLYTYLKIKRITHIIKKAEKLVDKANRIQESVKEDVFNLEK